MTPYRRRAELFPAQWARAQHLGRTALVLALAVQQRAGGAQDRGGGDGGGACWADHAIPCFSSATAHAAHSLRAQFMSSSGALA